MLFWGASIPATTHQLCFWVEAQDTLGFAGSKTDAIVFAKHTANNLPCSCLFVDTQDQLCIATSKAYAFAQQARHPLTSLSFPFSLFVFLCNFRPFGHTPLYNVISGSRWRLVSKSARNLKLSASAFRNRIMTAAPSKALLRYKNTVQFYSPA